MFSQFTMTAVFPELKKDIIDTLAKAQKLKSITLGVNLDDLLRPKSVGVISLNDKEFTDSGILKRFMKFTNRDSELHHGNDVSGFLSLSSVQSVNLSVWAGTVCCGRLSRM